MLEIDGASKLGKHKKILVIKFECNVQRYHSPDGANATGLLAL